MVPPIAAMALLVARRLSAAPHGRDNGLWTQV
jgi:hypothetical protein